jgi:DNA (cytosine-5)-methyltransferase 1
MGESVQYVCGMSVPPVMMAHIAGEIERQWFGRG